jgi:hypothetical protein
VNGNDQDQVSGKPVDIPLFRLRTFEETWIALLKPASTSLSGTRDSRCHAVLAAEAGRWLEIAKANGYFASNVHTEAFRRGDVEERNVFRDTLPPDQATFAAMLKAAQEDLTPTRIMFLELFVFADERIWRSALGAVRDFARELARRGKLHVDPEAVESIAWSLHGAEPAGPAIEDYSDLEDGHVREWSSPAAWRMELPERDPTGLLPAKRLARHRIELEEARQPIIAAIEAILTRDEHVDLQPPRRTLSRFLALIKTLLPSRSEPPKLEEPQVQESSGETLAGGL